MALFLFTLQQIESKQLEAICYLALSGKPQLVGNKLNRVQKKFVKTTF